MGKKGGQGEMAIPEEEYDSDESRPMANRLGEPDVNAQRIKALSAESTPPSHEGTLRGPDPYVDPSDEGLSRLPTWALLEIAAIVRRLKNAAGTARDYGAAARGVDLAHRGWDFAPSFLGTPSCW